MISWATLIREAIEARKMAYAPYSGYPVGAAAWIAHPGAPDINEVILGCNFESASYGLTTCAEQAVLTARLIAGGSTAILKRLVVVDSLGSMIPPCGRCLQLLCELDQDSRLLIGSPWPSITDDMFFSPTDLLPMGFKLDRQ